MKLIYNFIASCIIGGLLTGIIKASMEQNWLYVFMFITSYIFLKIIGAKFNQNKMKEMLGD